MFPAHPSILPALAALETETGARILHACESGSRAWGFASRDSDWDVRFIFAWPRVRYLSVQSPRDTLSRALPGDLDVSGWDLRMALRQLAKSNGALLEWLGSPIVYRQDREFIEGLDALKSGCFRARPLMHHYLGLAKSLRAQAGEGDRLNGKKCLYVLRATLAARWVWDRRTPPPVPFADLLAPVEGGLREEIDALVTAKAAGGEGDAFPVSAGLRQFIDEEREALAAHAATLESEAVPRAPLDELFRATLDRLDRLDDMPLR